MQVAKAPSPGTTGGKPLSSHLVGLSTYCNILALLDDVPERSPNNALRFHGRDLTNMKIEA